MSQSGLIVLPVLAVIVFFGDYWINTSTGSCARESALHEASWWGSAFFIIGVLNGLLMIG